MSLFQIYLLARGDPTAQALLAEHRQTTISEWLIRKYGKVDWKDMCEEERLDCCEVAPFEE